METAALRVNLGGMERSTTPMPGLLDLPPSRSGRCTPSPRQSPSLRRRRGSNKSIRERQDFFRKYSPLSSTNLLNEQDKNRGELGQPFVLDPTGKQAYRWLSVTAVAVVYFAWSIALRVSFDTINRWNIWLLLDLAFYSVYLLDVWAQVRTSHLRDGILENDVPKMWEHYKTTRNFKLDVISILPLDWLWILLTWSSPPAVLHTFKLMKFYRFRHFMERTESRSHYPNVCRVVFLLHNLLVIIHWNACLYFLMSTWIGLGTDSWVYPAWNETHNMEWGHLRRQYIYSFYWSTLTLTTIGELPQPQTDVEYVFVTFDFLMGILMFATLVGNVGSIITNMQKNRIKFQGKMDNIKEYMKHTKVPGHLQERVIKWFDYLWNHGHHHQSALGSLPDKLKAEIGIHVHFETLKKVDFFEECEQSLLWELVLRLRTQIYSPGEYVCRKGDVGREMYIVNNGKLEVLPEEAGVVVRQLLHGEYFGEISVLNLAKSGRRRTAFVRSVGYSSLLCLSQVDLLEVLKDYPKTMQMLIEKGKIKLGQDNIEEEPEPAVLVVDEEEENIPISERRMSNIYSSDDDYSETSGFTDRVETESDQRDYVLQGMQLHSVADQVIDLHIRLSQMEDTLKEVLNEVKKQSNPPPLKQHRNKTMSMSMAPIQEVSKRKMSSQF